MRLLLLSWEYPPLVVGGLGRHVGALAPRLAAAGHDVTVVTRGSEQAGKERDEHGVRIVRAAVDPLAIDFTTESLLAWSQASEHALVRAALPIALEQAPELIHAHDWLVAQTAITLRTVAAAPLVVTVHATESGRHQGWLAEPLHRAIDSVERWLVAHAAAVITCSHGMRDEVVSALGARADRVHVVPNGIDAAAWRAPARARQAARDSWDGDPLIVVAGRLVHEKGVQTAIEALRHLHATHPQARLVVAGTGPFEDRLRELARDQQVEDAVEFTGFVPDAHLAALLGAADAVVVPSRYEPFGLVALEAIAAGAPVVVSRTGGLQDLADAGLADASFPPDDATALAAALRTLLADRAGTRPTSRRARDALGRDYGWDAVAARTAEIYARVTAQRPGGP